MTVEGFNDPGCGPTILNLVCGEDCDIEFILPKGCGSSSDLKRFLIDLYVTASPSCEEKPLVHLSNAPGHDTITNACSSEGRFGVSFRWRDFQHLGEGSYCWRLRVSDHLGLVSEGTLSFGSDGTITIDEDGDLSPYGEVIIQVDSAYANNNAPFRAEAEYIDNAKVWASQQCCFESETEPVSTGFSGLVIGQGTFVAEDNVPYVAQRVTSCYPASLWGPLVISSRPIKMDLNDPLYAAYFPNVYT